MAYCERTPQVLLLCLFGLWLGGCATTANMSLTTSGLHVPTRVTVLQAPMTVERGRLQSVLAPNIHRKLSISDEPLAHGIRHAQEYASAAMLQALSKQPIVIVRPPVDEPALAASLVIDRRNGATDDRRNGASLKR